MEVNIPTKFRSSVIKTDFRNANWSETWQVTPFLILPAPGGSVTQGAQHQKAKILKFNMLAVWVPGFRTLALILAEEIADKKGHFKLLQEE